MGEAFLRQHLHELGVENVEVSSAGTHAQVGRPAMSVSVVSCGMPRAS